jgi:hypothetical protein
LYTAIFYSLFAADFIDGEFYEKERITIPLLYFTKRVRE